MIKYREGYKYQLAEDYQIQLPPELIPDSDLDLMEKYYTIGVDGILTVKEGYAWDGPSGPTIDSKNFMRGSLVHDVLYQAMRESLIPDSLRVHADELLRSICLEDGMSSIRAWWVYRGVRMGGAAAAANGTAKAVIEAP